MWDLEETLSLHPALQLAAWDLCMWMAPQPVGLGGEGVNP
jgi:hypothetical protein